MNLYRRFLGLRPDAHLSDTEVLVRAGLPDPTKLLRRARLRYFGTVHQCRAHGHWGVLSRKTKHGFICSETISTGFGSSYAALLI